MTDELTPAQHAIAIDAARQQLCDFTERCTDEQWRSAPVDGDPRPVGLIVDHVAHAYEYLGGWISELLAGRAPQVTAEIVDELNADHATNQAGVTQAQVIAHLKSSGDTLISLANGLDQEQLRIADGRVRHFLLIAASHPDSHRDEIEAALQAS